MRGVIMGELLGPQIGAVIIHGRKMRKRISAKLGAEAWTSEAHTSSGFEVSYDVVPECLAPSIVVNGIHAEDRIEVIVRKG
jgi:hypothetical protein